MLHRVTYRSTTKNMIARSARYTTDPWARPRRTKEHDRSLRSLHYRSMGEAAPHQRTQYYTKDSNKIAWCRRATTKNTIDSNKIAPLAGTRHNKKHDRTPI